MTGIWRRWARRMAPLFLAIGMALAPALSVPARAQEDGGAPGATETNAGRPLDGYLGTTCLLLMLFFLVGKSARR